MFLVHYNIKSQILPSHMRTDFKCGEDFVHGEFDDGSLDTFDTLLQIAIGFVFDDFYSEFLTVSCEGFADLAHVAFGDLEGVLEQGAGTLF